MTSRQPSSSVASGQQHEGYSRSRLAEERRAYLYILPTVVLLLIIIGYPVVQAFIRSLYSDTISTTPAFIGLKNYATVLVGDNAASFWAATENTIFFTVVTIILETLTGFLLQWL